MWFQWRWIVQKALAQISYFSFLAFFLGSGSAVSPVSFPFAFDFFSFSFRCLDDCGAAVLADLAVFPDFSDFGPAGLMFLGSRAGTQVGWKEGRILSRPQTTGQDTLAPAKVVVQGNILSSCLVMLVKSCNTCFFFCSKDLKTTTISSRLDAAVTYVYIYIHNCLGLTHIAVAGIHRQGVSLVPLRLS